MLALVIRTAVTRTFPNHVWRHVEEVPVNRTYDLFEKTAAGDLLWRASVSGLEAAHKQLMELAERTGNECLLMHLPTQEIVKRIEEKRLQT
jgi:DNA-binding IclR family transcriptional regulator